MTFLIDEQITPRISNALKEMGEPVTHVYDVRELGRGSSDAQNLMYCRDSGATLITLDRSMLTTPHLNAIILEHEIGVFFVQSRRRKDTPPPFQILEILVKHWRDIKRLADAESRPFTKLVKPTGSIRNYRG